METRYVRNGGLVASDMDGETVMMDIKSGEYYGIGGVGSRVWSLLSEPTTLPAIVAVICSEYDVDSHVCESDMKGLLASLLERGLISQRP